MSTKLLEPFKLGTMNLHNRVAMAPLTRCRATADHVPTDLMATYYAQRASAGLIIAEGTSPSANGLGYARIPGLFTPAHAAAWRKTTDAVHARGGHMFVQLMHTGRASHPLNMPTGRILAPSAVALSGAMWTDQQGEQPYPVPSAMTEADIAQAIDEYAASAALAMDAGFDGVELHSANGYLMDQFLNTASNQRTDRWGAGTIENRTRFVIEVATKVSARIGAARVGIRLSPYGVFNDMRADADMERMYAYLAGELSRLGLVYIHLVDHSAMGAPEVPASMKATIRKAFKGALILSGGYDGTRADADIRADKGDLVAFGRPLLANPDLVHRLAQGIALNAPDASTFYTPGEKGYTDYPSAAAAHTPRARTI